MNLFRFILVALTISSTSWAQIVSQPKATISLPPAQVQIVSPHGPSKKSFQPMTTPPEQQAPFSKEVRNNNSFLSQGIDTNALKEIPLKKKNVEFSMGTSSSGGGDARNIEAQSFPDANKLQEAISKVLVTVEGSALSVSFRQPLILELQGLQRSWSESFLVLPAMILFGDGDEPKGYVLPNSKRHFISLGSQTRFERGAPIYFSQKVAGYSIDDLAMIILHETIHHVLPVSMSSDEELVRDLTEAVVTGEFSPVLEAALRYGIYVRPNVIFKSQFLRALDMKELQPGSRFNMDPAKLQAALEKDLPENIAKVSVAEIRMKVIKVILKGSQDPYFLLDVVESFDKSLKAMVSKLGMSDSQVLRERTKNWTCRNSQLAYRGLEPCNAQGLPTVSDLFKMNLSGD